MHGILYNLRIARRLVAAARMLVAKNWTNEIKSKRPSIDAEAVNDYLRGLHNPKKEKMVAYWLLDKKTIEFPFSKKTLKLIDDAYDRVQENVVNKTRGGRIDFQDYDSPQKLLDDCGYPNSLSFDETYDQQRIMTDGHEELVGLFMLNTIRNQLNHRDVMKLADFVLDLSDYEKKELFGMKNWPEFLLNAAEKINQYPGITLDDFHNMYDIEELVQFESVPFSILFDKAHRDPASISDILMYQIKNNKSGIQYELVDVVVDNGIKLSGKVLDMLESSHFGSALCLAAAMEKDPDMLNVLMEKAIRKSDPLLVKYVLKNDNLSKETVDLFIDDLHLLNDCLRILKHNESIDLMKRIANFKSIGEDEIDSMIDQAFMAPKKFASDYFMTFAYFLCLRDDIPNNQKALVIPMVARDDNVNFRREPYSTVVNGMPTKDLIKIYDGLQPNYGIYILLRLYERTDLPEDFFRNTMKRVIKTVYGGWKIIYSSPSCPESVVWEMLKEQSPFQEKFSPDELKTIIRHFTPEMLAYMYEHVYKFTGDDETMNDAYRKTIKEVYAINEQALRRNEAGKPVDEKDDGGKAVDISGMLETARANGTGPDELDSIARNVEEARLDVALNRNTSGKTLEFLAGSKDVNVRRAVAKHGSTPPGVLEKLSRDKDDTVRYNVAVNRNTPAKTLWRLYLNDNGKISDEAYLNFERYTRN